MIEKNKIKKVIDNWDPIGLFPFCPPDEYSGEINEIFSIVNIGIKSSEELGKIIFNVFKKYFDELFTKNEKDCITVAETIIRL